MASDPHLGRSKHNIREFWMSQTNGRDFPAKPGTPHIDSSPAQARTRPQAQQQAASPPKQRSGYPTWVGGHDATMDDFKENRAKRRDEIAEL
jgi:hypothetical protein